MSIKCPQLLRGTDTTTQHHVRGLEKVGRKIRTRSSHTCLLTCCSASSGDVSGRLGRLWMRLCLRFKTLAGSQMLRQAVSCRLTARRCPQAACGTSIESCGGRGRKLGIAGSRRRPATVGSIQNPATIRLEQHVHLFLTRRHKHPFEVQLRQWGLFWALPTLSRGL